MTVYRIGRGGIVPASADTRSLDDWLEALRWLREIREEDNTGVCNGRTYETRTPKPEYL